MGLFLLEVPAGPCLALGGLLRDVHRGSCRVRRALVRLRQGTALRSAYARSRFMRRMFFFATKSFMYSLSLSWMSSQPTGRRGLCAQSSLTRAKRGTYQLYLLDLFLQLSVLSLVLDILGPRSDAGDVTLVLLL